MNNADWLDLDIPELKAKQTEDQILCFGDANGRAIWEEMDMVECVVIIFPDGTKQYGNRYEFEVEAKAYSDDTLCKIVQYDRFGYWLLYEHDESPKPKMSDIVEVELVEFDEYMYILDQAGSIDWSNVSEYRILLDPEND